MAQKFAIKSAVYGTLTNLADSEKTIDISYINVWELGASEDVLEARAQGEKAITVSTNKSMTFRIDAEVLDEDGLMLLIGGTKDASGKIVVGETPDDMYSFEGTFYLTTDDGQRLIKKAVIKKCKPQISDSVSLSALDLSTFSLTFDILKDDEGNYLTIEDGTEA